MAESQGLLPAYLIVGEDELKRNTVLKRLRSRVAALGDIDFNSDYFEGPNVTGEDVVTSCNTVPFASDVRLVVVKSGEGLKKAAATAIADYLKEPCTTTVLAVVATKMAKNTALYKAMANVGRQAVIDCSPMTKKELPDKVRGMALTHGFGMNMDAAMRLIDLVGENTVRIDAELQKIALAHTGKQPVGVSEVEALVARTAEAKPWDFSDAFGARNVNQMLAVWNRLDSGSVFVLLGRCVTVLRELLTCKALAKRGQTSQQALAAALGNVPTWKVRNHQAWARQWTAEELRHGISTARDCERAMKSGSNPEDAFLKWVLETARRRPAR